MVRARNDDRFGRPRSMLVDADLAGSQAGPPVVVVGVLGEIRLQKYTQRVLQGRSLCQLALYELDVVLTDLAIEAYANVRGFSHLLGECGISLFATESLARALRTNFPRSLDGADVILPIERTNMRRALDRWFEAERIRPRLRAETQDAAMLMALGRAGEGFFAVPSWIEQEVSAHHEVTLIARVEDVRERFYALTLDRRITHPGVRALTHDGPTSLSPAIVQEHP
jgi:LysR family transcriptional regulator, transcriptional activator of nhaA